MSATPRIIVDADPAVYRAGFASQQTYTQLTYLTPEGEIEQGTVKGDSRPHRKQLVDAGCEIVDTDVIVLAGKPEEAAFILRVQMGAIYDACVDALKTKAAQLEVVLSGDGNYRKEIATVRGYKANRKSPRPVHYDFIREVLVKEYAAYVVNEREADDEVSIRMHKAAEDGTTAILCTIDKDLDQIPGLHYDYKKHVFYEVDNVQAAMCFFAQVLSGDATDNIPGCRGVGPEKAARYIQGWMEDWMAEEEHAEASMDEFLWKQIVGVYTINGVKDYSGPKTPEELALETAQLVYLQTRPGELWVPPGYAQPADVGTNADD